MSGLRRLGHAVILAWMMVGVWVTPNRAWALGMEDDGSSPISAENYKTWPGLVEVLDRPGRVYHYWVNGHEEFFYAGTVADLHAALEKFAALPCADKAVLLLPGTGSQSNFAQTRMTAYDWSVEIWGGIAGALRRREGNSTAYGPELTLQVRVGFDFPLQDLKIPAELTVQDLRAMCETLRGVLSDSDSNSAKSWACHRLAQLDPGSFENVDALGRLLSDEDASNRRSAILALAAMGQTAKKHRDALAHIAKQGDAAERQDAETTLATVDAARDNAEQHAARQVLIDRLARYVLTRSQENKKQ